MKTTCCKHRVARDATLTHRLSAAMKMMRGSSVTAPVTATAIANASASVRVGIASVLDARVSLASNAVRDTARGRIARWILSTSSI